MTRQSPAIVLAHTDRMKLFSPRDLDRIASLGTLLWAEPITAWSILWAAIPASPSQSF